MLWPFHISDLAGLLGGPNAVADTGCPTRDMMEEFQCGAVSALDDDNGPICTERGARPEDGRAGFCLNFPDG